MEDYNLNKQIFTQEKGTIDGEIFFNNESRMDFLEVVNTNKKTKDKYRYHYMNKENEMIFRYDNAKHFSKINTFPHHKHTRYGVVENNEPNFNEVLSEIEKLISDNN
ncbi:MAG: hypothetical protein B6D61_01265 [Bacteroidetes bacterium 4484_249]|nr:MAG: hypothetical protein B6D61_01265 [Bacteroidetes bacterium 4484_249]